jgi:hypothetical protein
MKANHWSRGPKAKEIAAKISTGQVGKVLTKECRDKISWTKRMKGKEQGCLFTDD